MLILSIHSFSTLGKFYLNFLCLSSLICEMEVIILTSQHYYEGYRIAEWLSQEILNFNFFLLNQDDCGDININVTEGERGRERVR